MMAAEDSHNRPRGRMEVRASLDTDRGVFMISVAAELAGMHPQTLRLYEQRGLIEPKRSPKNTRLYSQDDVERLRRIQELTTEDGLNLAGVETVLSMERQMERLHAELDQVRERARELEVEMEREIDRVRRSFKAELVPYEEPGQALVPAPSQRRRSVRIPVQRGETRND